MKIGTRLGSYDIRSAIGAGGMGEVYRARDVRLDRDVAIKVLPDAVAADEERLARFAREARVLASLNHPHIAAIYGLEEAGGGRALVLEFVDGETLAARIARGPIPLKEALKIARAIADALDAAHGRGIIHRDLKPANVMVTHDGVVKVLDFGLAKGWETRDDAGLQTMTSPDMTAAGVILGTAAYMSPEQARGQTVDKRTDVWAFGCVLYEMLTGRAAFGRGTLSDSVAAVLQHDPDWAMLPHTTPLSIRQLLRRSLEKDLAERRRDLGDIRIDLEEALNQSSGALAIPLPTGISEISRVRRRERLAWAAAAIAAAVAVGAILYVQRPTLPPEAIKFPVPPPPGTTFPFAGGAPWPAISPDGRQLAFVAVSADGEQLLWLRALDATNATPLRGTEGAMRPFWSPDSRSLAYFSDGRLWRVDLPHGPPQVLAAAPYSGGLKGTWGRDVIAFQAIGGIQRVSPNGGAVTRVEATVQPAAEGRLVVENLDFLPDGRRFLYLRAQQPQQRRQVCVGSVDSMPETCVLDVPSPAKYAPPGYLLFVQNAMLRAQPFDSHRLELSGEPLPVSDTEIRILPTYLSPPFSVSTNGVLAYHPSTGETQLLWVDRSGKRLSGIGAVDTYANMDISPDERKLLFSRPELATGNADLWLYDTARGTSSRFTFDPAVEAEGVFSPDGTYIMFVSDRANTSGLYRKAVSGDGREELIRASEHAMLLCDWSSDGRFILYQTAHPGTGWDLWAVSLDGDRKPFPLVATQHGERQGRFSPDVRWIAYDSSESGRREIWIQPFPPTGSRWQISTTGGFSPQWRRDGKELYYVAADGKMMAVPVTLGPRFEFGAAQALFQTMFREAAYGSYKVSADGKRFLVNVPPDGRDARPITVVINWTAALRR